MSDSLLKTYIYGNKLNNNFISELDNQLYEKFNNRSKLNESEFFNLINLNKILDQSYIFRKIYKYNYFKQENLLNFYQIGKFEPRLYCTILLLENLMNSLFSQNDLISYNIDQITKFNQGLYISDGEILVKF